MEVPAKPLVVDLTGFTHTRGSNTPAQEGTGSPYLPGAPAQQPAVSV